MLPFYDISLSFKALRAVNDKINEMLNWVFISSNELGDVEQFEYLFPSYLIIEKPEWCVNKLKTFREMVLDNFIRDDIEPIYQYILYHLILDNINFEKDMEKDVELPCELWGEEDNIPEEYYVECIECYLEYMFLDYDFLTVVNGLGSERPEYFDLLPEDVREKTIKDMQAVNFDKTEDLILNSIAFAIEQMENMPTIYEKFDEPTINDLIVSIIKQHLGEKNIVVEREKPQGFAQIGAGEADFYFYDLTNLNGLAIGESKNINLFANSIKQLFGYMTHNIALGLQSA